MAIIRMKGVKIKNLDQLREHFDFTNAKDYLLQGTLSAWMREQGETELSFLFRQDGLKLDEIVVKTVKNEE